MEKMTYDFKNTHVRQENLSRISRSQMNELESSVRQILLTMRKAKLMDDPLAEVLKQFEQQLIEVRQERFDAENPEFRGY